MILPLTSVPRRPILGTAGATVARGKPLEAPGAMRA
jgi:hypothetical protein